MADNLDRLAARQRFHLEIGRLMASILYENETALAVWIALIETEPTPERIEERDRVAARCKMMRRDYRDQLRRIASLGMAEFVKEQKRIMVECVRDVRREAREVLPGCIADIKAIEKETGFVANLVKLNKVDFDAERN
jgi:hypothetical protein